MVEGHVPRKCAKEAVNMDTVRDDSCYGKHGARGFSMLAYKHKSLLSALQKESFFSTVTEHSLLWVFFQASGSTSSITTSLWQKGCI